MPPLMLKESRLLLCIQACIIWVQDNVPVGGCSSIETISPTITTTSHDKDSSLQIFMPEHTPCPVSDDGYLNGQKLLP
jgi:hypothetical protein